MEFTQSFKYYKHIKNPTQYLGIDLNTVKKDLDNISVKFLLAFPDLYEIGASNLGIQILYHTINSFPQYLCDRIFAPDIDAVFFLKEKKIPYLSLDNKIEPKQFDIIGFSIQYELSATTILKMLELMEIPLYSHERINAKDIPIICAGGPVVYNPLPFASFFDFFLIGDGEEAVVEKCQILEKNKNLSKKEKIKLLSEIEGVYSPIFPKQKVKKRILKKFEMKHIPDKPIIPIAKTVHERVSIEVSRGCTRGCRFCQAGIIYRPVREKNIDDIIKYADKAIKNTGFDSVSALSLSIGDYSKFEELLTILNNLNCNISIPSIRADKVNENVLKILATKERTGFTIAPEAGNETLRKVINKNLSNSEILDAVTLLYKNGWNLIKLYFMIGLPFEEFRDIEDIVLLSNKIAQIGKSISKKNKVNVSISTFVPKSHTPFQWFGQESIEKIKEKILFLKNSFKKNKNIKLKWHLPEMSLLEAVLSKGEKAVSDLIFKAYKNGAYLDAWTDRFVFNIWEKAAKEINLDLHNLAQKAYKLNENLPWDFIDTGITKNFLIEELRKSKKKIETKDCRTANCVNCGICDNSIKNVFSSKPTIINSFATQKKETAFKKVIFKYSKLGIASLIGQISTNKIFIRALRRTGISFKYTEGFKPKLKISFSPPPPFGVESKEELFEIFLDSNEHPENILKMIKKFLPAGFTVYDYFENIQGINLMNDAKYAIYSIYNIKNIPNIENDLIEYIKQGEDKIEVKILFNKGKHLNIKKILREVLPQDFDIELLKIVREKMCY